MITFITVLHIFACLALVAIVLLQHGKGADLGAAFGSGASNTVFGARGAGNFLTKLTTGCVMLFMVTSITLGYFGTPRGVSEIISDSPVPEPTIVPAPPLVIQCRALRARQNCPAHIWCCPTSVVTIA